MVMRAAVFGDTGTIGLVDRDPPEPRPGWVRLAVSAVGICGSDLNLLYANAGASRGVQPGHEVAGIVDCVGDGVAWSPGSRVALEPLVPCGACDWCRRGLRNLCPDHVAILGAGTIGLLSILTARASGAGEILVSGRYPHQRELAAALGADAVFEDADALLAAVGDRHVDVVVETVGGHADTLAEAVRTARSGGRIVMLGVFEGAPALPGFEFFRKELTLRASNCYGRECHQGDFALATDLVTRHAGAVAPLVTHSFKLDQVAEAFAAAADKRARSIKVQVEP
jgi:threonine dehydrogenase-like Zn-dependent dehydrogenase